MSQFDPHQDLMAAAHDFVPAQTPPLLATPRSVERTAVLRWMQEAAARFSQSPGIWMAIAAIYIFMSLIIALIPFVQFSLSALWPVCLGGLMLGCAAVDRGEDLELGHLFAGFHSHFAPLMALGLCCLVMVILVCAMLAGTFGVGYLLVWIVHKILGNPPQVEMVLAALTVLVGGSVVLVSYVLVLMGAVIVWFATALVALHDCNAWEAMRLGFRGALLNRWPLVMLCVAVSVLTVLSFTSMLLGFVLWLPIWWITIYSAYKDIFVATPSTGPMSPALQA